MVLSLRSGGPVFSISSLARRRMKLDADIISYREMDQMPHLSNGRKHDHKCSWARVSQQISPLPPKAQTNKKEVKPWEFKPSLKMSKEWDWREGSTVKSTNCSSRRPEFSSKNPLPATWLSPLMPSSGCVGTHTYTHTPPSHHVHAHTQNEN